MFTSWNEAQSFKLLYIGLGSKLLQAMLQAENKLFQFVSSAEYKRKITKLKLWSKSCWLRAQCKEQVCSTHSSDEGKGRNRIHLFFTCFLNFEKNPGDFRSLPGSRKKKPGRVGRSVYNIYTFFYSECLSFSPFYCSLP